jgi:hypothetical protein
MAEYFMQKFIGAQNHSRCELHHAQTSCHWPVQHRKGKKVWRRFCPFFLYSSAIIIDQSVSER